MDDFATTSSDRTATRHIIWDWNGTLLADNDANLAALNEVCAAFGVERVTLDHWRGMFRRPLIDCYEELLGTSLSPHKWETVNDIYHTHYIKHLASCGLTDGAPHVLRGWQSEGWTQSLLSMAGHDHVRAMIEEWELRSYFTRVDGRRFDTERDSKAEHLIHHLRGQEVDPKTAVLIGDIDDDARAAAEAGAQAVLVTTGLMDRERLRRTGFPVVDSIQEAVALVGDRAPS
ncbi:HAD family hydrolase [Spiractinospora alimapuensis]|uniref:HAD family hydrolase n=1 Tax=Spiractinospora alimapuensis TaxID=2820884 RepID=UPI001F2ED359|nr:HAD hydrolase-like protein [Spiractinospora alimapuensis]QVQ53319.1 HAD family hydrolase [Spiractinospora alimapuensis]